MKIKRRKGFIALSMVVALIIGCGTFPLPLTIDIGVSPEQMAELAGGTAASYLGYEGYKKSPEKFEAAYQIATGQMDLNAKVNAIRDEIADEITTHPVLKESATELLKQIKVDVTVDQIVIAPNQEDLVGKMVVKFARGIELAKAEGV